jgi:anti-sigma factor RsiW
MNDNAFHPSSEQLDRWRAGLVAAADEARQLERHVRQCGHCQQQLAGWSGIGQALEASLAGNTRITTQLRLRRRASLAGERRGQRPSWSPLMAAVAATLVLTIGVGIGLNLHEPEVANQRLSAVDNAATDVYAEIDFYVWLTDQKLQSTANGNES